jgi:hypothetical protein
MKNTFLSIALMSCFQTFSQEKWFERHSDTNLLVSNSNKIVGKFDAAIKKIKPELTIDPKAIKNTQLSLISFDPERNTINLPFWDEVIQPQKEFFTELAGNTEDGQKVFGLLFNGFYLAHELGHALADRLNLKFDNEYDSEYFANEIGIAYWIKTGKKQELKSSYNFVKKMLSHLKNPVPENENFKAYFTKHYHQLAPDPYKYGFFQFTQFVDIYENKSLPDFAELVNQRINN